MSDIFKIGVVEWSRRAFNRIYKDQGGSAIEADPARSASFHSAVSIHCFEELPSMAHVHPKTPITAILYSDGCEVDKVMARLAHELQETGVRLAGFIQTNVPRTGRSRCNMVLKEISSGEIIGISQDRGPLARGCHLDVSELLRGMQLGRTALAQEPDLLLINKFGKSEGEGGGFRPLIAEAIDLGVPVLIAVPWRNIDSWRLFSGDLATEVTLESLVGSIERIGEVLRTGSNSNAETNCGQPHADR